MKMIKKTDHPFKRLQLLTSDNRALITEAKSAYCTHCRMFLEPEDITEWIDDDSTAVCPECHVDAVLPDMNPTLRAKYHAWAFDKS